MVNNVFDLRWCLLCNTCRLRVHRCSCLVSYGLLPYYSAPDMPVFVSKAITTLATMRP